jgi:2-polyprenyl-3-methyl-5-hydroxy-6-metoxy-1,4-benzoquinol methylase
MSQPIEEMLKTLRCPACGGSLRRSDARDPAEAEYSLECVECSELFPVLHGIPRMLSPEMRVALLSEEEAELSDDPQIKTARSFGYEWTKFSEMYGEWEVGFRAYMQPHDPEFFRGKKVLDAGCGSGRFAYYAAKFGAEVWAIDLGSAVEVARRNTEAAGKVQVVQADLHRPPFAPESFDFIYSLGVLHHLPDPEAAFQNLLRYLKPAGQIQIYLYWKPERQPVKRALLSIVRAARQLTTRLPHEVVHGLSYPATAAAFLLFVWPYRILKKIPGLQSLAEKFPMKQYASLPFRVCLNDQLDRFSAPIENRYTKAEVHNWLSTANLADIAIYPNYGWVGTGRKPA